MQDTEWGFDNDKIKVKDRPHNLSAFYDLTVAPLPIIENNFCGWIIRQFRTVRQMNDFYDCGIDVGTPLDFVSSDIEESVRSEVYRKMGMPVDTYYSGIGGSRWADRESELEFRCLLPRKTFVGFAESRQEAFMYSAYITKNGNSTDVVFMDCSTMEADWIMNLVQKQTKKTLLGVPPGHSSPASWAFLHFHTCRRAAPGDTYTLRCGLRARVRRYANLFDHQCLTVIVEAEDGSVYELPEKDLVLGKGDHPVWKKKGEFVIGKGLKVKFALEINHRFIYRVEFPDGDTELMTPEEICEKIS